MTHRIFIAMLLLSSILVPLQIDAATPTTTSSSTSGNTIVNIPDANLRASINQQLGWKQVYGTRQYRNDTDAITRTEMQRNRLLDIILVFIYNKCSV